MDFKIENEKLKKNTMFRSRRSIERQEGKNIYLDGKKYIDFSSNNYLGLRDDARIIEAFCNAANKYGCGSGASRIVTGNSGAHEKLEKKISELENKEDTLLFNSGYTANIGVLSAIASKNDIVFSDRLNHASIIDGVQLSGARLIRYKHNDITDLEKKIERYRQQYKAAVVVTDTVFSMDGDRAKLSEIAELKEKYDFIFYVDEAHASGLFGKYGMGLANEAKYRNAVDIAMGTLGKSFGVQGAYVSAKKEIVDYLVNNARSFIYTTAMSAAIASAGLKAIEISIEEPFRREKVLKISKYTREKLRKSGFNVLGSDTQIIPIIIKGNEKVMKISNYLKKNRILVPGIRVPTVPKGLERVRLTINYNHNYEDVDQLIELLLGKAEI